MNRRQFIYTAAAGGLATRVSDYLPERLSGVPSVLAQATNYDLIIRGGRVIDPSLRLDGIRDVAIDGGRIAAVDSNIAAGAAETIDARGRLVVPGLIDIHTHAARTAEGPGLVLADGVTGWIDAGSQGADGIGDTAAVARTSPQLGRVLINVGRGGILPDGDTTDIARADVGALRDAIAKHRDVVVGVKARLSRENTGENDDEVLRRAQEVATAANVPVMIHMGQSRSPLPRLLERLKPGDIVTHMFAPPPNSIIDDSGRVLPEVLAARRRGVWFDVGNGQNGHIRWDVVERVMRAGFWPDTFSTDWNVNSPKTGVIDFPNCMSKFFGFGMAVSDAIACATVNAARTFAVFRDRGTLNAGAAADIALLELREGNYEFLDNYKTTIPGRQRLFPSGTILAGKRIPRP